MKNKNFTTCSFDLLEKDFGEYPPSPLVGNEKMKIFKVDILFASNFSSIPRTFYLLKYLIRSITKKKQSVSTDFVAAANIEIIKSSHQNIQDNIRKTRESILSMGIAYRYLTILVITLFLLMASPYYILKLIKTYLSLFRHASLNNSVAAYFKMPEYNGKISINKKEARKISSKSLESVISHEHIHFLQNNIEHANYCDTEITTLKRSAEFILNENEAKDEYLLYLISRDELEARLHEIIACYYRATKILPTEYFGFLKMMSSFTVFEEIFRDVTPSVAKLLGNECGSSLDFNARDLGCFIELRIILTKLKNEEVKTRFILEVLPVLYANLISLYSTNDERKSFMSTVPTCELYENIYGTSE